jgi:hypothetical protein
MEMGQNMLLMQLFLLLKSVVFSKKYCLAHENQNLIFTKIFHNTFNNLVCFIYRYLIIYRAHHT